MTGTRCLLSRANAEGECPFKESVYSMRAAQKIPPLHDEAAAEMTMTLMKLAAPPFW